MGRCGRVHRLTSDHRAAAAAAAGECSETSIDGAAVDASYLVSGGHSLVSLLWWCSSQLPRHDRSTRDHAGRVICRISNHRHFHRSRIASTRCNAFIMSPLFICSIVPWPLITSPLGGVRSIVMSRPMSASLSVGSRAPLSSKRPLLSFSVSVCLSVCLSVCATPNASSPTVHNQVLRNFGTVFS